MQNQHFRGNIVRRCHRGKEIEIESPPPPLPPPLTRENPGEYVCKSVTLSTYQLLYLLYLAVFQSICSDFQNNYFSENLWLALNNSESTEVNRTSEEPSQLMMLQEKGRRKRLKENKNNILHNILQVENCRVELCKEVYCWHRHHYNIYEWWQKNHAIYQNNERTSQKNKEKELFQPVHMNI